MAQAVPRLPTSTHTINLDSPNPRRCGTASWQLKWSLFFFFFFFALVVLLFFLLRLLTVGCHPLLVVNVEDGCVKLQRDYLWNACKPGSGTFSEFGVSMGHSSHPTCKDDALLALPWSYDSGTTIPNMFVISTDDYYLLAGCRSAFTPNLVTSKGCGWLVGALGLQELKDRWCDLVPVNHGCSNLQNDVDQKGRFWNRRLQWTITPSFNPPNMMTRRFFIRLYLFCEMVNLQLALTWQWSSLHNVPVK